MPNSRSHLHPILDPQTVDAFELPKIIRHNDQARAPRMRTDQHIMGAGKLTRSFQFGSDLAVVGRCLD